MSDQAGAKTEQPTPKRRREARRRGQIPRSTDLVGWIAIGVASYVVSPLAGAVHRQLAGYLREATISAASGDTSAAFAAARSMSIGVAGVLGVFLVIMAVTSLTAMVVQGGVTLTLQPLRPKWERLSPLAGFKRVFGPQSLVETAKAVLRLVVVSVLVARVTIDLVGGQLGTTPRPLGAAGILLAGSLLLVVRLAALAGIVIGLGDYAFQRLRVGRQLRMSKYEVKQEARTTDGDPFVRGRRRSLHAQLSRNQMLAAVGDARVVVVNPTHVAVALAYDEGAVPTVVAKGSDDLALRIRERAFAAGVPVVETRPLARILHDMLDVGSEIPPELYEAVAVVIAFVMRRAPVSPAAGVVDRVHVPPKALRKVPHPPVGWDRPIPAGELDGAGDPTPGDPDGDDTALGDSTPDDGGRLDPHVR